MAVDHHSMKSALRVLVVLAAVVMVAASCGGGDEGSIEIQDARYRLATADLGAGYMSVTNSTDQDVTLQAVSAEGMGRIELHESVAADDGTMSMVARPNGFVVAAGQTITLQPGGMHLMMFDPEGTDDLTLVLDFGDEQIEVLAPYDAEASAAAQASDPMADMDDRDS